STEPWGLLDVVDPAETYGVDELAVLARDPWTLFAWWEATPSGLAAARAELGEPGALVLRLHVAAVGAPPRSYDVLLEAEHRRRGAPPRGAPAAPPWGGGGGGGPFAPPAGAPRVLGPPPAPGGAPVGGRGAAPPRPGGPRLEPPAIVQHGPVEEIRGASRVAL